MKRNEHHNQFFIYPYCVLLILSWILLGGCATHSGYANKQFSQKDILENKEQEEIYIPKNLDDAIIELNNLFPQDAKDELKAGNIDSISLHFGVGLWIRNNWGLWKGSRLSEYFNKLGIFHPDDMSGIILDSYSRKLKGEPINLEEQIKYYKNYWREVDELENRKIPENIKTLINAIAEQNLFQVENLLQKGINVNIADEAGELVLVKAIETKNLEIIKLLVENGADVNSRDIIPHRKWPVILDAVYRGNIDIFKYLVEHGADVTATDDTGRTALMNAIIFRKLEILKYLVEDKGMDIDVKNEYGNSPIVYLFREIKKPETHDILFYLIKRGADLNVKDSSGLTILDWAINYNDTKLINLLESNGVKSGKNLD